MDSKKQFKDKKFGFGGKKKGGKSNTRNSTDDVTSYKPFRANPKNKQGIKRNKKNSGAKNKRVGKQRRQQMKSKK